MRHRLLLIAIAGCNQLEPSRVEVAADSAAGEVSFRLAGAGGAALVVPVLVNGAGPFPFILDTGATVTCVDESVAAEQNLPDAPGGSGVGAGVAGQGTLRLVTIDSLTLGGATAFDIDACVVDLRHLQGMDLEVDGLVGLNFLKEFDVALDFQRNVLRLSRPD